MRTITKQAVVALIDGQSFKKSNTEVVKVPNGTRMYLHGNIIAENINDKIRITNSGWFSNTTKDRLNAIPNVSINQIKGLWFLNGDTWDGSWIEI